MARILPPLNALRAFEAAARHLSFTKAADELGVTPAAVGHHMRALEDYLGFQLFTRQARQLLLTPYGEELLPSVQGCFDQVAIMVERLRRDANRPHLSLLLPPYFSAWWLTPRIGAFLQNFPEIQLHLEHTADVADFSSGKVDLAVHWTGLDVPGICAEPLLRSRRVPMCSPSLLARTGPLDQPDDLKAYALLHEFDHQDWERWFDTHGLDPAGARRGTIVDNYQVLVQAAVEGQGIALLLTSIYSELMDRKRLVMPFGADYGVEFTYHVLYPEGALSRPVVRAFRDWLFQQVAEDDYARAAFAASSQPKERPRIRSAAGR